MQITILSNFWVFFLPQSTLKPEHISSILQCKELVPAMDMGAENKWWIQQREAYKTITSYSCKPLLSVAQQAISPIPVKCVIGMMDGSSKMEVLITIDTALCCACELGTV